MTMTLSLSSLCSKWGFEDGDIPLDAPDWVHKILDVHGIHLHDVLRRLVVTRLLPEILAKFPSIEVYYIDSCHNPIRCSRVGEHPVDDYAPFHELESLGYSDVMVGVSWGDVRKEIHAQASRN